MPNKPLGYLWKVAVSATELPALNSSGALPLLYNASPLILFKVVSSPVIGSFPVIFLSNSIENKP